MAQIKKKFIQDGAVDGEKLLLLNNQAVKAKDAAGQDQELFKLDTAGVLKLLKLPVLPSETPAGDYQVASKKFVDDSVAGEASARQAAISKEEGVRQSEDANLQSQINTEKGRIDAILSASDADKDSFAEIVSLINSVDTDNDKAFAAYVLSNDAALADEIATRAAQTQTLGNAIYDEQVARENADAAHSSRLDVIEGGPDVFGSVSYYVRQLTDNIQNVQNAVDAEESRALQAESDLQGLVDSLEQIVTENPDSLSAKMGAITGSDSVAPANGLPGSMLYYRAELMQYTNDQVTNEFDRAFAAENALDDRLDVLEGPDTLPGSVAKAEADAKGYADGIVASEAATRSKADTDLQGQITTEKNRIDAILLSADADKDSFAEIVALINSVDTTNDKAFAAYVLSNDAALAQEVKDREAGDSALDARLDILEGADTVSGSVAKAEKDAKSYADGIVSAEAATRQKADDALDARLDIIEGADSVEGSVAKAEKDAKDYADSLIATEQGVRDAEITAVEGRLDIIEGDVLTSGSMLFYKAEANAYTDSQVAILDARIDSLEGVAYQKESFTLVSGDVSNGYVELAFQAQPKSTTVFIDRLGATEDVDYTVSVVGGKTRLTWIGQLASGGASALVVGDKVHVKYGK